MSKPKENTDITVHCETCGTNYLIMQLAGLREKIPDLDLKTNHYKHGLCKECNDHLEAGGVFFQDKAGRCVKVGLEASLEKISPSFRGKVICIPSKALDELIAAWMEAHPNPPPLKLGNGDVAPAG